MLGKDKKDDKKGAAQAAPKKDDKPAGKMVKLLNSGAQVQIPTLSLTLERGKSEVSAEKWETAKKYAMVMGFLKSGRLQEGWEKKEAKKK